MKKTTNDFNESTGTITGEKGNDIFYRIFPASDEKARLIIAHGLGEHSGRYGNLFERLIPAGLSVWALDFCGHGQSQGKRGHIDTFDQFILDLKKLVKKCRNDAPRGKKIFLLGHSMGGLIAMRYCQRFSDTIDGVVASSPGLGMKVQVPAVKNFMGKLMSSIWPGLSMGNELDAEKISHDKDVVRAYLDDPLVHDRVTARFFTEFLSAMEAANLNVSGIEIPVLMQVAGNDHLVDAQASKNFFTRLETEDKTLHVYDTLYHEIYNETRAEKDAVIDDLEKWLTTHV